MDFTGLENELLQDTTEALPSEEEVAERLYTVGWGEKVDGDGSAGEFHSAVMTAAELEEHFNNDHKGSVQLREAFGTFENYLSYMDKREDLKESLGVATWQDDRAAEREQIDPRYFELINKKMMNPAEFTAEEEAEMQQYAAENQDFIVGAYKEWEDDPAFAELNEEYGLNNYSDEKGRNYEWNGTGWIKTNEPDSFNLVEAFLKTTAGVTFGMAAGGVAAGLLPMGTPAAVSSALSSAVGTLTSQIVQTGEVSVEDILQAAAQGGASTAILGQLQDLILSGESDIVNGIVDWTADGINKVKDTIGDITSSTELPEWVWTGAGVVVDIIEGIQDPLGEDGSGLPNMGEGGATTLPDLTPDEEPVEEEIEEEVEEEEEVVVEDELEEEETVIVQPEEEVEEELEEEEEIVDIVGDDPEKDGGILGGIFGGIFDIVPDQPDDLNEEEEEETVIIDPPPVDPPVKDDDFNDPEDDDTPTILPPEIGTPVVEPPGVGEPPGGGGSEGGPGDGTDWSELFRYTNIKNPELSKYAPTIASVRSMFNELS